MRFLLRAKCLLVAGRRPFQSFCHGYRPEWNECRRCSTVSSILSIGVYCRTAAITERIKKGCQGNVGNSRVGLLYGPRVRQSICTDGVFPSAEITSLWEIPAHKCAAAIFQSCLHVPF